MSNLEEKLKESAMLYVAAKKEKQNAEARMESHKSIVEKLLEESGEEEIIISFSDIEDIKVKKTYRDARKFDKEQIAEDLNVEEDIIKQDYLIKAVEDRKLTFEKYKGYYYREETESVSIKTVKAKEEKKK